MDSDTLHFPPEIVERLVGSDIVDARRWKRSRFDTLEDIPYAEKVSLYLLRVMTL